ncbi:MAG: DUF560 domain-containing protein, partial [Desulfobacteraceae bacterium]
MEEGIALYKAEKYNEAVQSLKKARQKDPASSSAAFFLGLSYKQLSDYPAAKMHLRDAVSLSPKIKEALVELIDVLYQIGEKEDLAEAKKWIAVAKENDIFPAKITFLEGLVHQKEGDHLGSIEYFEKAKSLDPSMRQAADLQIAIGYVNARDLKKARDRFEAVVSYNPQSDMAEFARRYQESIDRQIDLERPLHITVSVSGGYDTNVVLKPLETEVAPDITNEDSFFKNVNARLDYLPALPFPWIFNSSYSFSGTFYDTQVRRTHDSISNNLYGLAGYNFGSYSLNGIVNYTYMLRRNPDWETLGHFLGLGPSVRMSWRQNHLFELFGGVLFKEYEEDPLIPEEDNDAQAFNTYLNWLWGITDRTFLSLRYDFAAEDTDGDNLDNDTHRFSANVSFPVWIDPLRIQIGAQAAMQDYNNNHSAFGVKRSDDTYLGFAGISWAFYKGFTLLSNYSYTKADSNLPIYEYDRHIVSLG